MQGGRIAFGRMVGAVRRNSAGRGQLLDADMSRFDHWAARRALSLLVLLLLAAAVPPVAQARRAPLIAAAGDIACAPNNPRYNAGFGTFNSCQQFSTSNLLQNRDLAAVLPLGDLQYDENGSLASFQAAYDPTWGRWRAVSHPVIGNHENDDGLGAPG
jgi:hypothetical protein